MQRVLEVDVVILEYQTINNGHSQNVETSGTTSLDVVLVLDIFALLANIHVIPLQSCGQVERVKHVRHIGRRGLVLSIFVDPAKLLKCVVVRPLTWISGYFRQNKVQKVSAFLQALVVFIDITMLRLVSRDHRLLIEPPSISLGKLRGLESNDMGLPWKISLHSLFGLS